MGIDDGLCFLDKARIDFVKIVQAQERHGRSDFRFQQAQ